MKRALLVRHGAFGDCIALSPIIKKLKELGYYIILYTSKRGQELYKHDSRVDEIILHDENVPKEKFTDYVKEQKEKIPHDWFCNFTGSIEHNVALHPVQPEYIYPKKEKALKCNKNYYEEAAKWAKLDGCDLRPSLQFTEEEIEKAKSYLKPGKFNVLWCLSGSGANKVYPWTEFVMAEVLKNNLDVHFITVGDERCKILGNLSSTIPAENITELAGEVSMRMSCALTSVVDLVVSPDTGVLHASGCYETPKIGLLGHTTRENITKHFINDYSLESDAPCSPCFFLIYDHSLQCPVDFVTHSAWCMSMGLDGEKVFKRIMEVIECRQLVKQ